jgi:ferredoxin--NADP+ reductase
MADRSLSDGPELPEVQMHLHRQDEPATGVVVRNEICTPKKASSFVRHIEFDVSGSRLAGSFRSGQSFGVLTPGLDEKGRPHSQRLYSFACPTRGEKGHGNIISTTVKRVIDEHWDTKELFLGVASNYLCDLKVGDTAQLLGPAGKRFVLPTQHSDHDYLFFATGTGIAPFRGMLSDLYFQSAPGSATLVMGSPYATELMYHDDFLALQQENPGFCYLTALSRERQMDCDEGIYVQHRIATHRDQMVELLSKPTTLIYICGLVGMEIGIFQQMAKVLPPDVLGQYLSVDPEAGEIDGWTRKMLHRKLKPTRRVFLEVY